MQSSKNTVRTFTQLLITISLVIVFQTSFATNCALIGTPSGGGLSSCGCIDGTGNMIIGVEVGIGNPAQVTGVFGSTSDVGVCSGGSDTSCVTTLVINSSTLPTGQTIYFKNKLGTDYFKCDLSSVSGFSNVQIYTPTSVVNAPIDFSFNYKTPETFATEIQSK